MTSPHTSCSCLATISDKQILPPFKSDRRTDADDDVEGESEGHEAPDAERHEGEELEEEAQDVVDTDALGGGRCSHGSILGEETEARRPGSAEDDGPSAVQQDAVLREPLDGLGEGAALLVLSDRHQLGAPFLSNI